MLQPVKISVTDRWHDKLSVNSNWYRKWHQKKEHSLAHWAALGIAFLIAFTILTAYSQNYYIADAALADNAFQNRWASYEATLRESKQTLTDLIPSYAKGDATTKQSLSAQMKAVACDRFVTMKLAVDENPSVVLRNAISNTDRAKLPAEVLPCVEERVSGQEGEFEWLIVDGPHHKNIFSITSPDGVKTELAFTSEHAAESHEAGSTDMVSVSGVLVGDRMVVNESASALRVTESNSNKMATSGSRKLGVVLFDFANTPATPAFIDAATIRDRVFGSNYSVADYYNEISFGQLTFTSHLNPAGDVFGKYRLPVNGPPPSQNGCNIGPYVDQAKELAAAEGFSESNYDHVIYVFPVQCGWSGIASYAGNAVYVAVPEPKVIAHEIGHNLRRQHANMARCRNAQNQPVPMSPWCSTMEYADYMSTMGNVVMMPLSAPDKIYGRPGTADWLLPSNTLTLTASANPSGTYTLLPAHNREGITSIRIPKAAINLGTHSASGYYYLDFRQPVGYDIDPIINPQYSEVFRGIAIRFSSSCENCGTYLIDTGAENFSGAILETGETFTDSAENLTIRTESVSPAGAVVRVSFGTGGESCSHVAPTLTFDSSTAGQTPAGQPFNLRYNLRNNDPNNCNPSTYDFAMQNLPSGWSASPNTQAITVAPGATVNVSTTITNPSDTIPDAYNLTAKATLQGNPSISSQTDLLRVVAPQCPYQNPSIAVSPTSTQAVNNAPSTQAFTVTVRNNDTSNCSPGGTYTLTTNTPPSGWSAQIEGGNVIQLNAGASTNRTINVTVPQGAATGTYSVGINARRTGYWSPTVFGTSNMVHTVLGAPTSVQGPTAMITTPQDGATIAEGAMKRLTINSTAEIHGGSGIIGSIVIKLDGTTIHTCNTMSPTFASCNTTYPWTLISNGPHTLSATAVEYPTGQSNTDTITFTKQGYVR